jgi:hypothetical protein
MASLNRVKILIVFILLGTAVSMAQSYVASSPGYILQSDSMNFGGGYSTSSAYRLQDTLGEIGSGLYSSTTMIFAGGYQAMPLDIYLAITSPDNPVMLSVINGVGGGNSTGSTTWRVQTDNPAGYELSVKADTSPALVSGVNSFADYVPSFGVPDHSWNTPTTESRFGFSPEGDDVASSFLDNGVSCGVGALDTEDVCWTGFSTTNQIIAQSSLPNYPAGASTTIKFKAEVGSGKLQQEGSYIANITVTAITP